jgi:hypothetical protein
VTVAYSRPPGQQYYPPYQPYQQPYPPARPTNGLAVAALVCGAGAFVTGITFIPAIICGHLARREIRRTGEQGDGMAIAGLVCGYIGGILSIAVILVVGLLASRAASTVNVQLLPAVSSSAVPAPAAPAPAIPVGSPVPAVPVGAPAPAVIIAPAASTFPGRHFHPVHVPSSAP